MLRLPSGNKIARLSRALCQETGPGACNAAFIIRGYTYNLGSVNLRRTWFGCHNRIFPIHASSPIIGEPNRGAHGERRFRAQAEAC
jgi:hypothetical protein